MKHMARLFGPALAGVAVCLTLSPAQALTIFNEIEPNNTRLTAQFLAGHDNDIRIRGTRRHSTNVAIARSADWYRFDVNGPSYLSLNVAAVGLNASSARLIYGLYDSSGTLLSFGGGPTMNSAGAALTLGGAGSYYVAVMGYTTGLNSNPSLNFLANFSQAATGNFTPTAGSSSNWDYNVTINYTTVPEPSEWAVLGLGTLGIGGLMLRARRKTLSSLA
jgi:hypothetical protein